MEITTWRSYLVSQIESDKDKLLGEMGMIKTTEVKLPKSGNSNEKQALECIRRSRKMD